MMRHFAWLIAIGFVNPIAAQTPALIPAQATVVAIPNTAAGSALRAWLDAFNSADTARLRAYAQQYEPDLEIDGEIGRASCRERVLLGV